MAARVTLVHKLRAWDAGVDPRVTTWGDVRAHAASEVGVPLEDCKLL